MFDTITQLSKGCLVRSGIIQRVFQKVAYVRVILSVCSCTIHRVQCTMSKCMSVGVIPQELINW